MRGVLRQLRSAIGGRFVGHVTTLISGTAGAQALTFLVSPVLSRMYEPTDFAALGLFTALSGVFVAVATLRYELAIVAASDDDEAANVLVLSLFVSASMAVVGVAFVAIGGGWFAERTGVHALAELLWWLPLAILGAGAYHALNYWSTRRSSFVRLSISQVLRSVAVVTTQVSAGVARLGATGLIGGNVVGQVIASSVLGRQVWVDDRAAIGQAVRWSAMVAAARRHAAFARYGAPQALLNATSQGIPAVLMAVYFEPAVVGAYVFAVKVLQMPVNLIGQSVRQVFYPRAARVFRQGGDVFALYVGTVTALALVALVPAVVMGAFGSPVFGYVFGAEWRTSGVFAQWLVLWLFFLFLNSPATSFVQLLGRQRLLLHYDALLLVARGAAIVAGAAVGDPAVAVGLFASVGAAFNAWLIVHMGAVVWRTRGRST